MIGARLDRLSLSPLHVLAAGLCAAGFAIDLLELAMGNILSVVFSAPPQRISASALSWLISAVYLGAVLGAPLVGGLATRFGIKRTFVATAAWIALTSVAAAFSPGAPELTIVRLLSGLALGGFPPLMVAYLTDILPPGRRALVIFWVCALAYMAPPLGVFLVRGDLHAHWLGLDPWRLPFAIAAGLGGLTAVVMLFLPESPRWLSRCGHAAAADAACRVFERSAGPAGDHAPSNSATSSPGPQTAPQPVRQGVKARVAFLGSVNFLIPWATVAFPLVTGPVLLARGYGVTETLFYVGAAAAGPTCGALLAGLIADKLDRRTALLICAAFMVAAVGVFFVAPSPAALAAAVLTFGIFSALYMPVVVTYGAELFPSGPRAAAMSWAWMLNRIGAAIAPAILLPLARAKGGQGYVAEIIIGNMALSAVLVRAFGPPGAQRQSV